MYLHQDIQVSPQIFQLIRLFGLKFEFSPLQEFRYLRREFEHQKKMLCSK